MRVLNPGSLLVRVRCSTDWATWLPTWLCVSVWLTEDLIQLSPCSQIISIKPNPADSQAYLMSPNTLYHNRLSPVYTFVMICTKKLMVCFFWILLFCTNSKVLMAMCRLVFVFLLDRPLQRICAGMLLCSAAFVLAGFVQLKLEVSCGLRIHSLAA